ncbi:MAG: tetratricopeptide repeat protein, partial [Prevotella sp.]|nr:tetratricopeptide repeat protein [Prevotella sp.]
SLQIRIRLFGKDNQHYASSMNNFALVYHKLGNYTKAIEAFKDYTDIVRGVKRNVEREEDGEKRAEVSVYKG